MLDLQSVKEYLRVDGSDEDTIITSLILTSKNLVEEITRQKLSDYDIVPEIINQAVLYSVATMYENRQAGKEGLDMKSLIDFIKRLTFAYRKESF